MSENKKILGATPTQYNNIKFRSKLEARIAKYLDDNNIKYEYETTKFKILDKFKYNGQLIRAVHYTPDFIIGNYIIEVKGYPNDSWSLKKKLILKYLIDNCPEMCFRQVKTIKDVKDVLSEIL